jgi:hypothetical protein
MLSTRSGFVSTSNVVYLGVFFLMGCNGGKAVQQVDDVQGDQKVSMHLMMAVQKHAAKIF